MSEMEYTNTSILVYGHNDLSYGIVSCLLKAGWIVNLVTNDAKKASAAIRTQLKDNYRETGEKSNPDQLLISNSFENIIDVSIAIIITEENEIEKKRAVAKGELKRLPQEGR